MATHKALVVAINDYPGDGNDLPSCIEDAKGIVELLQSPAYGFQDVRTLTDGQATTTAVRDGLGWLFGVGAAGPGAAPASADDRLVFYYSGHGFRAEKDGVLRECLCLQDGFFFDEELSKLTQGLPPGIFTVILDSCHSGGMDKRFFEILAADKGGPGERVRVKTWLPEPGELVKLFTQEDEAIPFKPFGRAPVQAGPASSTNGTSGKQHFGAAVKMKQASETAESQVNGLLITACRADQTASASSTQTQGRSAFTFCLLGAIQKLGAPGSPGGLTTTRLFEVVTQDLAALQFKQTPVLLEPPNAPGLQTWSFLTLQPGTGAAQVGAQPGGAAQPGAAPPGASAAQPVAQPGAAAPPAAGNAPQASASTGGAEAGKGFGPGGQASSATAGAAPPPGATQPGATPLLGQPATQATPAQAASTTATATATPATAAPASPTTPAMPSTQPTAPQATATAPHTPSGLAGTARPQGDSTMTAPLTATPTGTDPKILQAILPAILPSILQYRAQAGKSAETLDPTTDEKFWVPLVAAAISAAPGIYNAVRGKDLQPQAGPPPQAPFVQQAPFTLQTNDNHSPLADEKFWVPLVAAAISAAPGIYNAVRGKDFQPQAGAPAQAPFVPQAPFTLQTKENHSPLADEKFWVPLVAAAISAAPGVYNAVRGKDVQPDLCASTAPPQLDEKFWVPLVAAAISAAPGIYNAVRGKDLQSQAGAAQHSLFAQQTRDEHTPVIDEKFWVPLVTAAISAAPGIYNAVRGKDFQPGAAQPPVADEKILPLVLGAVLGAAPSIANMIRRKDLQLGNTAPEPQGHVMWPTMGAPQAGVEDEKIWRGAVDLAIALAPQLARTMRGKDFQPDAGMVPAASSGVDEKVLFHILPHIFRAIQRKDFQPDSGFDASQMPDEKFWVPLVTAAISAAPGIYRAVRGKELAMS